MPTTRTIGDRMPRSAPAASNRSEVGGRFAWAARCGRRRERLWRKALICRLADVEESSLPRHRARADTAGAGRTAWFPRNCSALPQRPYNRHSTFLASSHNHRFAAAFLHDGRPRCNQTGAAAGSTVNYSFVKYQNITTRGIEIIDDEDQNFGLFVVRTWA